MDADDLVITLKKSLAKLRLAADKSGKIEFVFDEKGKRK